ncbi:MAG: transposase [Acidobacteriaceae bacterium]|nr:transposase [Acidobacteriaceae bacterium]
MDTITGDGQAQVDRQAETAGARRSSVRRFTNETKLRIVAESYEGDRQISATARRHGIARTQLAEWRKAAREGRLGARPAQGFAPALIVPEVEPASVHDRSADSRRLEVVTANGRRVIVDRTVDIDVLLRLVRGLEALR